MRTRAISSCATLRLVRDNIDDYCQSHFNGDSVIDRVISKVVRGSVLVFYALRELVHVHPLRRCYKAITRPFTSSQGHVVDKVYRSIMGCAYALTINALEWMLIVANVIAPEIRDTIPLSTTFLTHYFTYKTMIYSGTLPGGNQDREIDIRRRLVQDFVIEALQAPQSTLKHLFHRNIRLHPLANDQADFHMVGTKLLIAYLTDAYKMHSENGWFTQSQIVATSHAYSCVVRTAALEFALNHLREKRSTGQLYILLDDEAYVLLDTQHQYPDHSQLCDEHAQYHLHDLLNHVQELLEHEIATDVTEEELLVYLALFLLHQSGAHLLSSTRVQDILNEASEPQKHSFSERINALEESLALFQREVLEPLIIGCQHDRWRGGTCREICAAFGLHGDFLESFPTE